MTDERADAPATFAAWLRARATKYGYDVDTPRSGGMQRLAADSGVTMSVLSKMLGGKVARPENHTLRGLAKPLQTTLGELLLRSGQATEDDLPASSDRQPIDPQPNDPLDARIEEYVRGLPPHLAQAFRERAAQIRQEAREQEERRLRDMADLMHLADGTGGS